MDAEFDAYYRLLAKGEALNAAERADLARLRETLPPMRIVQMLGDTRREQLVYEAVDQFLRTRWSRRARRRPTPSGRPGADARRRETRIADIWKGAR